MKMLIMVAVLIALALAGWYLYYGSEAGVDTAEEAGLGGALFDGVSQPVSDATSAIPETNPLEQVQANPLEGYKNPFSN